MRISNLLKTKPQNMKWLYYIPIVLGSIYIIELLLGLSILSGVFAFFDDVKSTIDRRDKAIGASKAFEFADEVFYKSRYRDLVEDYEKLLKSKYQHFGYEENFNLNSDLRDDLSWVTPYSSIYTEKKKRWLEYLNQRYPKSTPTAKLKEIYEVGEMKKLYKAGSIEGDSGTDTYDRHMKDLMNEFKINLRNVEIRLNGLSLKRTTKRHYVNQLKSQLATDGESKATIAYIHSTMFDQISDDEDFLIYAALRHPDYKYEWQNKKASGYFISRHSGLLITEAWPVVSDVLHDREYLEKHDIVPPSEDEMRKFYKYMVVNNKAKLQSISAKHPPKIARQVEENNFSNDKIRPRETEAAAEVVNG